MSSSQTKQSGTVLSFEVPWLNGDFDSKRASDVIASFERKLIGVDAARVCTDDGRVRLIMRVRGGADEDYLQRLWRGHLRDQNVPICS